MPSATLVVGITLWYAFNVGYNVYNKMLSKALDFPMLIALTSLGVGLLYFVPLWILGLRKAPKLTADDVKACTVLSMLHTVGHVGAVVAMSAGAVSFTHIIKALEPMFSVFFGYVLTGKIDSLKVNIWLVPIIAGVGWAAVGTKIMNGEDVFGDINPVAFGGAMTSNLAFSLRGLLSKRVKAETKSENLTSSNLYAVLTLISFFLFLPFALVLEGNKLAAAWPPVENLQAIPEKIMGVPRCSPSRSRSATSSCSGRASSTTCTTRWPTSSSARSPRRPRPSPTRSSASSSSSRPSPSSASPWTRTRPRAPPSPSARRCSTPSPRATRPRSRRGPARPPLP